MDPSSGMNQIAKTFQQGVERLTDSTSNAISSLKSLRKSEMLESSIEKKESLTQDNTINKIAGAVVIHNALVISENKKKN